jgi:hypothetical protein
MKGRVDNRHDNVKIFLGIVISINAYVSYFHPFGTPWPDRYWFIASTVVM